MANTFAAKKMLTYFAKARTVYNTHSPFVYELTKQVLEDDRHFYAYDELEALRKKMLELDRKIEFLDFGAGSHSMGKTTSRKIKDVAKTSLISPLKARWMFRLINWLKPEQILEIGTSLGLSALYMQSAALKSKVLTMEGNPSSVAIARRNFEIFPYGKKIEIMEGPFAQTLPSALKSLDNLGLVFMDGNHQKAPTLAYFQQIKPFLSEKSFIVLDDIYWSKGMSEAWAILKEDPQVTLSIDLFQFGILFFRKEQKEKEHHILAPSKWKPWVRAW